MPPQANFGTQFEFAGASEKWQVAQGALNRFPSKHEHIWEDELNWLSPTARAEVEKAVADTSDEGMDFSNVYIFFLV